MTKRFGVWKGLAVACALMVAAPFLATPAQAWWAPYGYGYGWRRPVVVVPPPVVYAAPRVAYVRPPAVWIGPAWYGGRFVRGHWR